MKKIEIIDGNKFDIEGGIFTAEKASGIVKQMMKNFQHDTISSEKDFIRIMIANAWGTAVKLPDDTENACEKFLIHLEEFGVIKSIL